MKFKNIAFGIFISCLSFSVFSEGSDSSALQKSTSSEAVLNDNELSTKLDKLRETLDNGQYSTARKYIESEKMPPIAVSEVLRSFANGGDTPAMWMLAEQYLSAGRPQDSANWVYAAFLGTRIDSSLCTNRTATGLERNIVDAYSNVVQQARQDPLMMQSAINFALSKQKTIENGKRDPTWICSMVRKNGYDIEVSSAKRDYYIQQEIDKFEKTTDRKER